MAKQSLTPDTPNTTAITDREQGGGFLLDNVRMLGVIGLILLAVLGGIVWYFYSQGKANDQAQIELARIRPYYDKSDFATAINGDTAKTMGGEPVSGLRHIVEERSGTPAGKIAALFLGNAYLATGEVAKAAEPYETAKESEAPLVRAAAYAGIAAVQEEQKKHEEAAKSYETAASEDRSELNTAEYLLGAARNYEKAGNKEEAIDIYRRIASQYPTSTVNTEVRMALARHNEEL
jgi:tetratricopeptide (TPR) repeat protein